MTSLTRDVHKWLQSLDLTFPVRNVRRDFSNGYLVAEIFSWYFPQDIQMHSYNNCNGLQGKLGNWCQLQTFFKRRSIDIPQELIEGTLHCRPDAAELLAQFLYSKLTNKKIKRLALNRDIDFTDHHYQLTLPMHARNTATMAVKTNLKITELETEPNIITCQQKAQDIIYKRTQHRQEERIEDPDRFDIRPSIGQRCVRKPGQHQSTVLIDQNSEVASVSRAENPSPHRQESPLVASSSGSMPYREIVVNQLDHTVQQIIRPSGTLSPNNVLPPISGM
ncbi:spermatogenesis-associated protein 4-like [Apostichopus japonicus]|uniref:spermatogenesis-associated protein 4-like n=1 Tax=Stichopus japonicus TaxID=307972 RepID=UPI003AB5C049